MTPNEFYAFHRSRLSSRTETLSYFLDLLSDAVDRERPDAVSHRIVRDLIEHNVTTIFDHAESPIESLFFATLAQGLAMYGRVGVFHGPCKNAPLEIAAARMRFLALPDEIEMDIERVGVNLTMQAKFPDQGFRVDLLAWRSCDSSAPIVIECDGFDYHSDRLSFTKDRKRDRTLQEMGYRVARFSGSEIHNEPIRVAAEVLKMLYPAKVPDIADGSPLRDDSSLRSRKIEILSRLERTLPPVSEDQVAVADAISRVSL